MGGFYPRYMGGQGFDFDYIFESFFGGRGFSDIFGGRRGPKRGHDLRYDLEITLEEAAEGVKKEISIPHTVKCTECKGTGAKSASDVIECPQCGGSGFVRRTARTPFGVFSTQTSCPKCRGQGTTIKDPCNTCKGKGKI